MKKTMDIFYKLSLVLFISIFILIFVINLYNMVKFDFLWAVPLALIFLGVFYLAYRKIKTFKIPWWITTIFLIIALVLITIIGLKTRVGYTWDYGTVLTSAYDEINHIDAPVYYFGRFPNNIPLLVLEIIIGKICKLYNAHITLYGFQTATILFNSVIVFLNIVLFNYIVKKVIGDKAVILSILLSILFAPLYLYATILYTDTLALLLMLLSFLFYYLYEKYSNLKKKRNVFFILTIISIVIGYKFKATNLFVLVAILIDYCKNWEWKKIMIFPIAFVILMLPVNSMIDKVYKISNEDMYTYGFPYSHWIMMSLNPKTNGGYSSEDVAFSRSFANIEERKEGIKKELIDRFHSYSTSALLKRILIDRNMQVWADPALGTDNYLSREPYHNTIITKFVNYKGKYHKFYITYLKSIFCLCLLGAIISGIIGFKTYNKYIYICNLLLIGIFLFELVWEIHARYIFTFVPFLMICSIYGFTKIIDYYKEEDHETVKNRKKAY